MMNNCEEMENMKGNNNRYRASRKKTRLEKWLIVICTMLLLILVAVVVLFVLYSNLFKAKREVKPETKSELNLDTICNNTMRLTEDFQFSAIRKEKKRPNVCNTQACVEEAATIIRKIDFSVPPCKNFYRFACGNYIKDGIPNTLDYTRDVISDMEKEVNLRTRRILESLNRSKRSENEIKMKKFYRSCVDMRRNNLSTREIIENILRQLQLEEWPSVQLNAASMTLEEKLAIIMGHGGRNPLFHVEYEGMNTVMLQEPKTILREQFLLSEENDNQAMDEYRRLMMEVFTRAGFSSASAENEVESVLEFEISIAEIARDHLDDAYSLLELSQLEAVLPKFNWLPLFRHFYHYLERVGYKAKDAIVVLQSPGYLEELIQLLQDTNSKTVESYVMWSFLFQFLHMFDSSLAKHYHALNDFVNQNFKDLATTDWESCTLLTKSRFREALHHRYAKEVIKETVLKKVEEIDRDIKHALDEFVQSDRLPLHYNSKSWKEISNISLGIPYKDVHASEKPHKIYPRMRMTDDFIANIFRMEKEIVLSLVITGSPQELPSSEDMLSIKPLYEDVTYELPLGVFQPPYVTEEKLSYSNYAALGFPIAVKLLRSIRDLQILSDVKSTENKNTTSAEETSCFETEYSEFLEMNEINEMVNTSLVLDEYLHSGIGIRLAFEAYKMYLNSSGIEEKLPGLDFEADQLFFINHAGLMCEAWTEETEEKYLRNGHIPAEFRVNSALRNSKEFARTFNCPAGSNMNPNLKCLI